MFKIRGSDNQEYGPVSAEVVRQWITERRANAQTLVMAEGSTEFKPLAQFPQFQPALAQAQAAPSSRPTPSSTASSGSGLGPASSGLGITSLALGILSFILLPFIAAVPAIVTGHLALSRIRRDPASYAGKGPATAGLILGYLNVVAFIPLIAILAGLLLPALAKAKGKAQRITCVSNMKQIGLAARMYANDHNEVFPPNFLSMSNELNTPKILICPSDSAHLRVLDWSEFSESANLSYEYLVPGTKAESTPQQTVFRCPIHNNAGLADGSVVQMPTRR